MAEENFSDNLLKAILAHLTLHSGLLVAREMFGKSYFALGVAEKAHVDQATQSMAASNYQGITPEGLAMQKTTSMGFLAGTQQKP